MDSQVSQEWLTALELAGLPGMPKADRSVRRLGLSPSRPRGVGKGYEYHISGLPKETQRALNIRAAKARAKEELNSNALIHQTQREEQPQALWNRLEHIPQSMQDKAKLKLNVLIEFFELRDSGMTSKEAEAHIKEGHGVSRPTLHRWKKAVKEAPRGDWLPLLIDDYKGNQTGGAECTPEAWEFFKADYLRQERPTVADCYRRMTMAASEHEWVIPSRKTIENWVKKKIPATTRVALREGELALMKRYPALDRSVKELHAMQWANGDGYQHNVFSGVARWRDCPPQGVVLAGCLQPPNTRLPG